MSFFALIPFSYVVNEYIPFTSVNRHDTSPQENSTEAAKGGHDAVLGRPCHFISAPFLARPAVVKLGRRFPNQASPGLWRDKQQRHPPWVAKEQDLFRKYGIDADLVFIIAGRAAQAMLAGQVRVGLIGATHVTNAVTAGGDLTMILGLQNRLDFLFIARPSVKRADELKGKKVAIGTPSGSAALATYVALDHLGLIPRRDNIVLLQLGDVPERVAALRAGNVEAVSLSPELGPVLTAEGYRILVDIGKENIPFQSAGLVISRNLMKSEPQLVENIAKAIVEGVAFIHNPSNKTAVEQTIAKYLRLGKPERVEKAYQDLRQVLPRKPCPTLEGVATVLKLLAHHGINPKASQLKPEDVADMSLCKKLDESGFMDRLYQER